MVGKDTIVSKEGEKNKVIGKVVMPIGKEQILSANELLNKYKEGKKHLEGRIIENEQWWKLKQWEYIDKQNKQQIKPTSAWLFNCIISKHADAMDAFPEPNILPREPNDQEEAKRLSSILPVVFAQNSFESTYSKAWWDKSKSGTGVYGVFWDSNKLNGLGDISIKSVDILNLFWEPGISDIQESQNMFYANLMDIKVIENMYPITKGKLKTDSGALSQYVYDDNVSTVNKCLVVDWYYKKWDNTKRKSILHYVKYVGDMVLISTENEPDKYPNGLYMHGQYPFIFDVLYPYEGTPAGLGFIDVCKDSQKYIDLLDQAVLTNALAGAMPRWWTSENSGVNESDYLDFTKPFVKATSVNENLIRPIESYPLPGIYYSVLQGKIDELKETSGNRDVNNGGSPSGVTAASAIAALQEQSGKLSRDMIKATYDAYEKVSLMSIELIREFYTMPRQFRIVGNTGQQEFVSYSNSNIAPQYQGMIGGVDTGYRVPLFDIEVVAQKENLYTKTAYNEFALQLYQNGFFNPDNTTQALAALEIMDFKGKDKVTAGIKQNGELQAMLQQWQQLAITLAQTAAPEMVEGLSQSAMSMAGVNMSAAAQSADVKKAEGTEDTRVQNARQQAQERTKPR